MKSISPTFRRRVLRALIVCAFAAGFVIFLKAHAQAPGGVLNLPPDPLAPNGGLPPPPAPAATPPPAPGTSTLPKPAPAATPFVAFPSTTPGNTVVNANQSVQATKRGVCENHLASEDFVALGKGCSWYYNWAASTNDVAPGNVHMDFIPMAWGHKGDIGAIAGALGRRPRAVLVLNEPNLKGQAFLLPSDAADFYLKVKQTADSYHVPVVGPNMALGSPKDGSITAVDPVSKQKVTYTSMKAYLDAYFYYVKQPQMPAGIGVHSYNGLGDIKGAVAVAYNETHKPVWVTEFAWWNAPSPAEEVTYVRQAVEFLESSPQVAGYAWFKERVDKNPKISLLDKQPGKLTPVGEEYVKVPSHSMHVFYRIPGLLDSGKYVANDRMTLEDTTDAGGDFDMASHSAAWVDYNIQVDVPGTYLLRMRVSGAPGRVEVVQDGVVLGSVDTIEKAWHTEETAVPLAAGAQTIRVRFSGGQSLHSIDFSVKPGIAMTK